MNNNLLNESVQPFIWLFSEKSLKEESITFFYDETLDLNLNIRNEPCILVHPFFAGTQTKTSVIDEDDDSD
jgi:hypothetical protein